MILLRNLVLFCTLCPFTTQGTTGLDQFVYFWSTSEMNLQFVLAAAEIIFRVFFSDNMWKPYSEFNRSMQNSFEYKWWMKLCQELLDMLLIMCIITYMKKLLDSDWLRTVQFKCNTSAKSVTPVQITHRNSGSWLAGRQ